MSFCMSRNLVSYGRSSSSRRMATFHGFGPVKDSVGCSGTQVFPSNSPVAWEYKIIDLDMIDVNE